MKVLYLLFLFSISFATNSNAQLWEKFKKKTKDKISERVIDKVENEISEDIANRAMKNLDNLYENLWRKSYNEANGEDLNEAEFEEMISTMGDDLNEALGELNKAADVPDQYVFNIIVDYTSLDENGNQVRSEMYFSRTEGIMGIRAITDDKESIIVMDAENDLMVIYNDNGRKKTAQAIPAMFTMTSALAMTSEEAITYRMPLSPTGRTKNIAGYRSKEYIGEDEDRTYTIYMSSELPFDWRNSYGELLKSIVPAMYDENEQKFEGMMMKSIDRNKDSGKESHWEVNKISKLRTSIVKSDYEFKGLEN